MRYNLILNIEIYEILLKHTDIPDVTIWERWTSVLGLGVQTKFMKGSIQFRHQKSADNYKQWVINYILSRSRLNIKFR